MVTRSFWIRHREDGCVEYQASTAEHDVTEIDDGVPWLSTIGLRQNEVGMGLRSRLSGFWIERWLAGAAYLVCESLPR
jgi:hypothetical protein